MFRNIVNIFISHAKIPSIVSPTIHPSTTCLYIFHHSYSLQLKKRSFIFIKTTFHWISWLFSPFLFPFTFSVEMWFFLFFSVQKSKGFPLAWRDLQEPLSTNRNIKTNRHHLYCHVLLPSLSSAWFCVRTNVNADTAVLFLKMQSKPGSDWCCGRGGSGPAVSGGEVEGGRWRAGTVNVLKAVISPVEVIAVETCTASFGSSVREETSFQWASSGPRDRETWLRNRQEGNTINTTQCM